MSAPHDPATFAAAQAAPGPITITRAPGSVPDVPPDEAVAFWRVNPLPVAPDVQADWHKVEPEPHHPPAPSSEEEGEVDLHAALAAHLARTAARLAREEDWLGARAVFSGECPSTIPDLVRDGPPPPVGEETPPVKPSHASASSVPRREPPAKPRRSAAPRREPPPQPLRVSAPPREPRQPRHDLFSPERRAQFLSALAETGSVRAACARTGVSPQTAYLLRRRSAQFAAGWDGALVLARQVAEDVLAFRALEGVEEPVFYRGEKIGSRLKFDARLLLAHLARLDAHVAASPHAERRAARFDELLALVAGAEPPEALMPAGDPELDAPKPRAGRWDAPPADPQLPPERADFVDAALRALPRRAGQSRVDGCAATAHEAWSDWRAAAEEWADRVTGPAAPVSQAAAVAAEPVSATDPAPASARRAGRDTLLRTLSGVSTSALGSALGNALGSALAGGLSQAPAKQPGSSGNREGARFPDHPGLWSPPPSIGHRRDRSGGTL